MNRYTCILTALILLLLSDNAVSAKSYKLKLDHTPKVEMTGVASKGYFIKAWGTASNADKAIDQARIDAVAAALFYGIEPSRSARGNGVAQLPSLMKRSDYDSNKAFFDNFFKKGSFLQYINDVNSSYPTGQDNVKTPDGRRVGIEFTIDYDGLRSFLQENGLLKKLNDHFNYPVPRQQ